MTVSKLGFSGIREFLMWISRYGSLLGKKISESIVVRFKFLVEEY